jgi:hypothetical protein
MDPDKMLRIEDAIFILGCHQTSGPISEHIYLTWPAVSMISVAYSCPLYLMTLLNVFSIVG